MAGLCLGALLLAISSSPAVVRKAKAPDGRDGLEGAVPLTTTRHMPNTATQYHALQSEIAKSRPEVLDAQQKSSALKSQADALRQKLIEAAAQVQKLEQEGVWLDREIVRLAAMNKVLSASFVRKRAEVATLVAVLQRMQHDVPPVLAFRADDALAAAHSSMLVGAALPRIYTAAADLARQLEMLQRTRAQLARRRADAARNSASLTLTRNQLDQLLAIKAQEADAAGSLYEDLAAKLQTASDQAASLESLLEKVALLRTQSAGSGFSVVSARGGQSRSGTRRTLLRPVVGRMMRDGAGGSRDPGVNFLAPPGAEVIAPADAQVLFAGAYHKAGQVLILQSADGYDLVLAGLERVDVRSGDRLLAGEPVGRMPRSGAEPTLYFELRQNGKGLSPASRLENETGKVRRS